MKKKDSDIVIIIIGVVVLVAGILAYIFMKSNYFNKESVNLGIINNKSEVYQFLSDTKDIYCDYVGWLNYYIELKDMESKDKNSTSAYDFRVVMKKVLLEDTSIGLNELIESYSSGYSNFSFPKTVKLISSSYENHKISYEYLSKVEKNEDSFYENGLAYRQAAFHSFDKIPETLLLEYKAIRGDNEALRPKKESDLLDLKNLCPEKKLEDKNSGESEGE